MRSTVKAAELSPLTNAQYQESWKQRKRAQGLVRVEFWVLPWQRRELKAFVEKLRTEKLAERRDRESGHE